jgi:hypothetical protein
LTGKTPSPSKEKRLHFFLRVIPNSGKFHATGGSNIPDFLSGKYSGIDLVFVLDIPIFNSGFPGIFFIKGIYMDPTPNSLN